MSLVTIVVIVLPCKSPPLPIITKVQTYINGEAVNEVVEAV